MELESQKKLWCQKTIEFLSRPSQDVALGHFKTFWNTLRRGHLEIKSEMSNSTLISMNFRKKVDINRSTRSLIETWLTNYWQLTWWPYYKETLQCIPEVSLHQQTSDTMQTTNPPIISLCTLLNLNLNLYNQYLVLLLLFYQTVIMRQAFDRLGRKCPYLLIAPS